MPKVNFPSDDLIQRIHLEIMADVKRVHADQADDHNEEQCMQCALSDGFKNSPVAKEIVARMTVVFADQLIGLTGLQPFASVGSVMFSLGLMVGRAELSEAKSISELEKLVGSTQIQ